MPNNLKRLRTIAFHRQSGHCCYCRLPMWLNEPNEFALRYGLSARQTRLLQCTGEHCVAKCAGGPASVDNIAAACLYCNNHRPRGRTHLDADRFAELVRSRMTAGRWHARSLTERFIRAHFR